MRLASVDVETTGVEPEDEVLEIGVVILNDDAIEAVSSVYVLPNKDIPPQASAVHHITMDSLAEADLVYTRDAASDWLKAYTARCDAVIAHNAKFDSSFLPELNHMPWVCTLVCAKHLWPDAPAFGLQVLRYWLKLKTPYLEGYPHSARYDACTAAHLYVAMKDFSKRDLIELSKQVPIQKTCLFGKHRGQLWDDVPRDYVKWILQRQGAIERGQIKEPPFPEEVVATCRLQLGIAP